MKESTSARGKRRVVVGEEAEAEAEAEQEGEGQRSTTQWSPWQEGAEKCRFFPNH